MAPKELNFITGNKNKLTEVQAILGETVDLKSQSLDLVEIQGTIEEVVGDKCRRAAEVACFFLLMSDLKGAEMKFDRLESSGQSEISEAIIRVITWTPKDTIYFEVRCRLTLSYYFRSDIVSLEFEKI